MFERIKELCRLKGITIAKLERDLDMGNGSIKKGQEKLSITRAKAIADYFDVSIDYLVTGTDSDNNPYEILIEGYKRADVRAKEMIKRLLDIEELL